MDFFKPNESNIDTRKRRRFFGIVKRIQRVSAVVLIWLLAAAVLYGAYTVVFVKPYFRVSSIEVSGNFRALSRADIVELSGIKMGDHLFHMSVVGSQKRLMENPWIKEAAVHRKLPNMLWIYVREHVPVAVVRLDKWYYVDRFGFPFKELDLSDESDFPVITGFEGLHAEGAGDDLKAWLAELLKVRILFESSRIGDAYGLSEIHYDPHRGVSIITLNDPMELRLGFGSFVEKIGRFQAAYSAIQSRGGVVAYVDLSSEGKVVVKYGT